MAPRVAVAVLSLAAVPANGGTGPVDGSGSALPLVWLDPSDVAWSSGVVAREEAAKLLARMGATVRWRRGTSGEVNRNDGVWVILVAEDPPDGDVRILGATRPGHSGAPIVWIRVANVRAAIATSLNRSRPWPALVDSPGLGVALGRVIAHEVVHAVVPSVPHGTGLMSRSLSRFQLTAASLPVDREVVLALQAALRDRYPHLIVPLGAGLLAADATAQAKDR